MRAGTAAIVGAIAGIALASCIAAQVGDESPAPVPTVSPNAIVAPEPVETATPAPTVSPTPVETPAPVETAPAAPDPEPVTIPATPAPEPAPEEFAPELPDDVFVCGFDAKPAIDYNDRDGWWAYCEGALAGDVPDVVTLPPCEYEDSWQCFWNAATRGNGAGDSFVALNGTVYYLGGE